MELLEMRAQKRKRDRDLYRPDHALFCSGEESPALSTS
jgi:hypothetical protein